MRQHETRQTQGERGFADTRRPADQPSMRNTTAFVGIEQCALGVVMAKQAPSSRAAACLPTHRCRRWLTARSSPQFFRPVRMQSLLHDRPDTVGHDRHAALGRRPQCSALARRPQEPDRPGEAFREIPSNSASKRSAASLPAPALCTGQPNFGGHIQNECEFGNRRPNGHPLQAADQSLIDIAERALIDAC